MVLDIADSTLKNLKDEDTILGTLTKFGEEVARGVRKSLAESGHNGKSAADIGTLLQSIKFDVSPQGNGIWRFTLSMEDYADYINKGVTGVGNVPVKRTRKTKKGTTTYIEKPGGTFANRVRNSPFSFKADKPISAKVFDGWAQRKGLNPFLVARSVWRRGLRANHFIDSIIDKGLVDNLIKKLERAGAKEIEHTVVRHLLEGKIKI
jgi:hypothetical protein